MVAGLLQGAGDFLVLLDVGLKMGVELRVGVELRMGVGLLLS